ncbi:hypothetical protein AX16_005900 [Volvariella volvacea WC 439]|nr:hypothetical protein AX16_005900 [Volvariella volvacea WC 439]
MKIANRTFILSGGSSGLGLATLEGLLKEGAYVAVLDLSPPPSSVQDIQPSQSSHLPQVLASIDTSISTSTPSAASSSSPSRNGKEGSNRVLFIKTDVAQLEQIEHAVNLTVEWTKETGAALGGVINCAGFGIPALMINRKGTMHPQSLWDRLVAVNLSGTFHLTRLTLKHLVKVPPDAECDGERGVVIMVSSEVAYDGPPGTSAYAATKGALRSMSLPMARDCAPYGIRVVTISPGLFRTPLTDRFPERVHKGLTEMGLLFPNRYGKPHEFAATVRWILECSYVNGENIRLNGGQRIPSLL